MAVAIERVEGERGVEVEAGNGVAELAPEQAVAVLFERLKEEIRHARSANLVDASDRGMVRSRLRAVAERFWVVSFIRPLERRPGLRGLILQPIRVVIARLVRWYVEPFAANQRAFNDSSLKLVDQLFEEVDAVFGRMERLEAELAERREDRRLVGELEERLRRLERGRSRNGNGNGNGKAHLATVAAQPRAAAMPDYFAFEVRMRGLSEVVRERQRPYLSVLRDHAPVLDVGCGRGEMLALLDEAGIEACGVDADADMVAAATADGLVVAHGDALEHLEALPEGSVGAIFGAQFAEHLPPPELVRFLELARTRLRPDGLLVLETINPASLLALRHYYSDLTHAQPLVPETLELLARHAGFGQTEIHYLNPPAERLAAIELPAAPEFDAARQALAADIQRLNETLYGPLDYALYAWP